MYKNFLIVGLICIGIAIVFYFLGNYIGQMQLRERWMKRFDEVREKQLGIVTRENNVEILDADDPLYKGASTEGGDLSFSERRFVSQAVLGPLVNEALTQQMPWGRWKTRDSLSWAR